MVLGDNMTTSSFYYDSSGDTGYISEIQDLLDQINAALAAALAAQAAAEQASQDAAQALLDCQAALAALEDALGLIPNITFIIDGNGKLYLDNQGNYTSPLPSTATNGYLKNTSGVLTWVADTFDSTLDRTLSGDWTFQKNVQCNVGTGERFYATGSNAAFGLKNHYSGATDKVVINLSPDTTSMDAYLQSNDDLTENIKLKVNDSFGLDGYFNGASTRTFSLGYSAGNNVKVQDISGTTNVTVTADTFKYNTYDVTTYNVVEDNTANATVVFSTPKVYVGSAGADLSGTISSSFTDAKVGIVQKIYHNSGSEPSWPATWVRIGSGEYSTGTTNIIYVEYVRSGRAEYWITQEQ